MDFLSTSASRVEESHFSEGDIETQRGAVVKAQTPVRFD